ncbi:MFS transporter [Nonomuraea typhae]|uniref:MFS transporter n=1 Tax=Nonomuraea typhae TaxID=2603600 RepID=A0ABW7Z9C9_9ACTN
MPPLVAFVITLELGALYVAMPGLSADLASNGVNQLWTMDIAGFLMAGFFITLGNLGSRIGHRRLLLIGAACYGVLSLTSAYVSEAYTLLAVRLFAGVAGAMLLAAAFGLIGHMFPDPRRRRAAVASNAGAAMLGLILGPLAGGVLFTSFWWGSVFLISVPVMALLVVSGPFLLPEARESEAGPIDATGMFLYFLAVMPIVDGVKVLTADRPSIPLLPPLMILFGAGFGILLVRRLKRRPSLSLNGVPRVALAATMVAAAVMAGAFLLVSQYLLSVLALGPLQAGLWLPLLGVALAAGWRLSSALPARETGAIAPGVAVAVAGFALLSQAGAVGGPVLAVLGGVLVCLGAGSLLAFGVRGLPGPVAGVGHVLGAGLGIAVMGAAATNLYRMSMADVPVPGAAADMAEHARTTIAGATDTARDLVAGAGTDLVAAARDAFTTGLSIVALAGAVVLLAFMAVVLGAARRRTAGREVKAQPSVR